MGADAHVCTDRHMCMHTSVNESRGQTQVSLAGKVSPRKLCKPYDLSTGQQRHLVGSADQKQYIQSRLRSLNFSSVEFRRLRMCSGSVVLESENTRKAFPEAEQCRKHNWQEMLAFPDTQEREATWFR